MKETLVTIDLEVMLRKAPTFMALANTVNNHSDAKFIDGEPENYDFKNNKVRTMKYVNGTFKDLGFETPNAEFWFFYSICSSKTDVTKTGYNKYADYRKDLLSFLEKQVSLGNVGEVINSPSTERKTTKAFLAELNPEEYGIIPSYIFDNFDELYSKFLEKKALVSKPNFGGDMKGVKLIDSVKKLVEYKKVDFSEIVFQDYYSGIDKRMWIAGGKFVEGRVIEKRNNPWTKHDCNSIVYAHNEEAVKNLEDSHKLKEFYNDLKFVNKMIKETGLLIGSVDFLGNKINEINGAGTQFYNFDRSVTTKVDAIPYLVNYLKFLLI